MKVMIIRTLYLNFVENFDSELITSIQPVIITVLGVPNLGHPRQCLSQNISLMQASPRKVIVIVIVIRVTSRERRNMGRLSHRH